MTEQEFTQTHLATFTPQQLAAVKAVEGATLLLAVPGSGKTTVLIHRLGYMVSVCGIDPASILTVTYTVAATEEMKARFAAKFGCEYENRMEFRTINGICQKIIHYYCATYGRQAPELIKESEQAKLVSDLYRQIVGEYPTISDVKNLQSAITYIKNMRLSDEQIDAFKSDLPKIAELYRAYCAELRRRNLMDFDDQMRYALTFLEKRPPVLAHFQDIFRYLCVDESQDTSKIQHDIIKLLASKYGNLFMVGDEDQSIYGFRAAYPEALMNFEKDYEGAKVLLMEQNFRSTVEVVAAANAFVKENRFRREKVIEATRESGLAVQKINALDRTAQYKFLFALAEHCDGDTAILYRNNDSAMPLIDHFERKGIAYNCKKPEEAFFSNRVVGDITDIIHFAHAPTDAELFMRIYYRFDLRIPKKAAETACVVGRRSGKPLLEELASVPDLPSYAKDGVIELAQMMEKLPTDSAVDAIDRIWNRMGYGQYVMNNKLDRGKYAILRMLAANEPSAMALLRRLEELQGIVQMHTNSSANKLTLSTIHSSKGLEYERVYLLDVLDGILPSISLEDAESDDEIKLYEEERRLYYVAMTRAKDELYLFTCEQSPSAFTAEVMRSLPREVVEDSDVLSFVKKNLCGKSYTHRTKGKGVVTAQCGERLLVEYAGGGAELMTLSQMIAERDRTPVYETSTIKEKPKKGSHTSPAPLIAHDLKMYTAKMLVGKRVKHVKFGVGTILSVEERSDSITKTATIRFEGMKATKKLALPGSVEKGYLEIEK